VPTLYRDALERNGECAKHVAYWTTDKFDERSHRSLELGYALHAAPDIVGPYKFVP
jgi:hypothetical protein